LIEIKVDENHFNCDFLVYNNIFLFRFVEIFIIDDLLLFIISASTKFINLASYNQYSLVFVLNSSGINLLYLKSFYCHKKIQRYSKFTTESHKKPNQYNFTKPYYFHFFHFKKNNRRHPKFATESHRDSNR
jgi:hypothetical protein